MLDESTPSMGRLRLLNSVEGESLVGTKAITRQHEMSSSASEDLPDAGHTKEGEEGDSGEVEPPQTESDGDHGPEKNLWHGRAMDHWLNYSPAIGEIPSSSELPSQVRVVSLESCDGVAKDVLTRASHEQGVAERAKQRAQKYRQADKRRERARDAFEHQPGFEGRDG